jgi:hypothetical protein
LVVVEAAVGECRPCPEEEVAEAGEGDHQRLLLEEEEGVPVVAEVHPRMAA